MRGAGAGGGAREGVGERGCREGGECVCKEVLVCVGVHGLAELCVCGVCMGVWSHVSAREWVCRAPCACTQCALGSVHECVRAELHVCKVVHNAWMCARGCVHRGMLVQGCVFAWVCACV